MEAPASPAGPVRELLARRERRANSLLITIFGDSILPRGGTIWLGSLIALAQPFGISERLVRTGVYRLARQGWLEARSRGRRAYYTLTPSGLDKFAEADRRIYAAQAPIWDGHWRLIQLLPQVDQRDRQKLRRELRWLGFGQVTPTLLAHPSVDEAVVEKVLRDLEIGDSVLGFRSDTMGFVEGRTIRSVAEAAWNLTELNSDYEHFILSFTRFDEESESFCELVGRDAFILRTLLVHDYRRLLLKDPHLPLDLLPRDWHGTVARDLCAAIYRAVADRADAHLTELMQTFTGTIPAPAAHYHNRFADLRI